MEGKSILIDSCQIIELGLLPCRQQPTQARHRGAVAEAMCHHTSLRTLRRAGTGLVPAIQFPHHADGLVFKVTFNRLIVGVGNLLFSMLDFQGFERVG